MKWEPIESAPKDGSPILACAALGHYVPITAYWSSYHPNATGEKCWRTSLICGNKLHELTHWMPLPQPPVTEGDRQ